jgi:hypothetical protein
MHVNTSCSYKSRFIIHYFLVIFLFYKIIIKFMSPHIRFKNLMIILKSKKIKKKKKTEKENVHLSYKPVCPIYNVMDGHSCFF